jgi:copper(I)-binding protein
MTTPRLGSTLASMAIVGALTGGLTACGDDTTGSAGTSSSSTPPGSTPSESDGTLDQAASLAITDPWVKAADSGMTAAFGTLVNSGDTDVVVMSATSEVTPMMELHETVESADGSMAMQPKPGGFVVPAGGEHELAPGGDHLMIMDLTRPVLPGEVVTVTLTLQDGSTLDIEATVKSFTGADEDYQGDGMDMDSGSE